MFGFFNVHKPVGPTSHDVVVQVRRLLSRKLRVGHAGTLDPFASGVLVLCVGPAVRLANYVQAATKHYLAEVTLGAVSTTDDIEGDITPTPEVAQPAGEQVQQVVERFVGSISQRPPAYSAVHVGGRRAYRLARLGRVEQLPARPVTIHSLRLAEYAFPRVQLEVVCGAGTYIRSLARDIGEALGMGGYCSALVRRRVGAFAIETAVDPDLLDVAGDLISPLAALAELEKLEVPADDLAALVHGRLLWLDRLRRVESAGSGETPAAHAGESARDVALLDAEGRLLGIGELPAGAQTIQPRKVFVGL